MDPIDRAAKIRHDLHVRGLTFADIDRLHDLPPGTARSAWRHPHAAGEAAIAAALACGPHELWPERYDAGGQRLQPQPHENYRRPPTLSQRRKQAAA